VFVGALLLIGFARKLGLLPFYEWFPGAYGAGSGASGAIMSGVVLNAAFFALSRGLVDWLPSSGDWLFGLGVGVTVIGVLSSILAVLYAFQQDDWRRLAVILVCRKRGYRVIALGASLIFPRRRTERSCGACLDRGPHSFGGHALAKGGLFLCADGV